MNSRIVFLSTSLLLFLFFKAAAQDLEQFKWKNRVLLVFYDEASKEELKAILGLFEGQESNLKERKLLFLMISSQSLEIFPESKIKELPPERILNKFKDSDAGLELVLIGLDGTVKLRREEAISPQDLYAIIDAMPMRRAELE